jgi:DNA-binding MarR family transcriptional regulator
MASVPRRTAKRPSPEEAYANMFRHPGFLIRRAHQITNHSFAEHYGPTGITPTQATILKVVLMQPGLDQVGVGRVLGLDRTTATTSVATLAKRKLLERRFDPSDRRRRTLYLTAKGEALLAELGDTSESREELLSVFSPRERAEFIRLLEHFVISFNSRISIPMELPADPLPLRGKTKRAAPVTGHRRIPRESDV